MSHARLITLICDKCQTLLDTPENDLDDARAVSRENGWLAVTDHENTIYDMCDRCKPHI